MVVDRSRPATGRRQRSGYRARPMRGLARVTTAAPREPTPTRSRSACSRARSRPTGRPRRSRELLASGEARRSFKALALAHADGKRWLLVGLGAREDFTPERARVAAAVARERARELSARALCWELPRGRRRGDRRRARGGHDARRLPLRALQVRARARTTPTAPPKQLERLIVSAPAELDASGRRGGARGRGRQRARATCRTGPATT